MDIPLTYLEPTKLMVFMIFAFACFRIDKTSNTQRHLFAVLFVYFITELFEPLLGLKYNTNSFYNISIALQGYLWLKILELVCNFEKMRWLKWFFVVFAVLDFLFADGMRNFTYYPFVLLTIIYVPFFLGRCIEKIRQEDISFFTSDIFLLGFAPVLFFLAHCLLFAFGNRQITSEKIAGITLYRLMNVSSNLIFYIILTTYILRTTKQTK